MTTTIHTTNFFYQDNITKSISYFKNTLKEKLISLINGKSIFSYSGKVCNANILDFHRILSSIECENELDHCVRNIIISHFYSTEVKTVGSGFLACMQWVGLLDNKSISINKTTSNDVFEFIDCISPNSLTSKIVKKSYCAGLAYSKLTFQESEHSGTKLTILDGTKLSGNIDELFCEKLPKFELIGNAYIVSIEGIVENISQLHSILETSMGKNVIICALGFLPDVSNTLYQNYISRKLNVFPFVIKGINKSLIELTNEGISCLSPDMGMSISDITTKELKQIILTNDSLIYENNNSIERNIIVSFGSDLGHMKGIAIDRTKFLSSYVRNLIKTGNFQFTVENKKIIMSYGSLCASNKCLSSLEKCLQSLGGVVSLKGKERKCQNQKK